MARFTDQHRKVLQRMMSENSWDAIEAFRDDYLLRNYAQASIKRDTEFDTMWYAAQAEGAKLALAAFFNEMEQEAARVETS